MAKQESNKISNNQSNIRLEITEAKTGLNLDSSISQVRPGELTYALNATVENFDSNSVNYQNEPGNELCLDFPTGYKLIGSHFIPEKRKNIFFLANINTGGSEIGYMDNNDCQYHTLINSTCLNFNIKNPILKVVHKITNCTTEIYWTDGVNSRRYLDIENIPYKLIDGTPICNPVYSDEVDCNQLKLQPDFSIPELLITQVRTVGALTSGTYQFAVQYADASGSELTSFYSVTNAVPIADKLVTTVNFNYEVGKSIIINVSNLDLTGQFQYFNLAVIKTINNVSSVELVGTYNIEESTKEIIYTGADQAPIQLSLSDIFEKFPYYDIAQDVTAVQDVLVWDNLTSIDRINYQSIANEITLGWETYRIPADENYADEINATNLRGYMRDEVYAFEIVFLLKNGKQTDGFHIPGRARNSNEDYPDVPDTNNDFVGEPDYYIGNVGYKSWWKVYNTASVTSSSPEQSSNSNYKGPWEYGEFAYWESTEEYPCNENIWGELAGQPIRHHKFPDVYVTPIMENGEIVYENNKIIPAMQNNAIFPIGVRVDNSQIHSLIQNSSLTQDQKDDIIAYKIVRGDRGTNKSVIAKGILRNVNKYTRDEEEYYYPNYPYNDLSSDPYILANNNAWSQESEPWLITLPEAENDEPGEFEYTSSLNGKVTQGTIQPGETVEICSLTRPTSLLGNKMLIGPGNYDLWKGESYNPGVSPIVRGWGFNWSDPFTDDNSAYNDKYEWLSGFTSWVGGETKYGRVAINGPTPYETGASGGGPFKSGVSIQKMPRIEMPPGEIITGPKGRISTLGCKEEKEQPSIEQKEEEGVIYRQIFNSPETSFGQPLLGNVLKLESVLFGAGKAHWVQVKDNAKYKLLSREAQEDALNSSKELADITSPSNVMAMFTAYQAYLTIYINGITRKNYGMSFNSRANYDYSYPIDNNLGIKQRDIDFTRYLIPGVQSLGNGELSINNWNRETSVFIRTLDERKNGTSISSIPFPNQTPSLLNGTTPYIEDKSRFTITDKQACATPEKEQDLTVVSYYASMKNIIPNQWGQIYSYQTIDTGYQSLVNTSGTSTVFGGDTFISRFAFKTKLPYFIDNRVGAPDDSDIFYDELGNIGYPKYWHSARSILEDYNGPDDIPIRNIISYKAHNFDCPNDPTSIPVGGGAYRTFYDGYMYLFAYGIPNFYCETTYNTDLRQAFNNREGDFWPHVSSGIPDDWLQEVNVPIAQDNTYYYNVTYSKQNKENVFTHLPPDWEEDLCYTHFPFRAIYSDASTDSADVRVNNWLVYRALSFHDFPQNYGALISLDGIQNKSILARFENKSLLYNNLLTIDTSNPQAAYIGNPRLFDSSPPIDFAETDLGYVGSQNKFLLKIPQGQITVDAKRGQVFLVSGSQVVDLTTFGSGVNRFMSDHLPFEILQYFPNVYIDNHFNDIGLHGVYDSKFDRVIITKLDYIPIDDRIQYDEVLNEFYILRETGTNILPPVDPNPTLSRPIPQLPIDKTRNITNSQVIRQQVYVNDRKYFCNKSWTMSFNFNTKSWTSFHTYIPNFYIGENNFFYSGNNRCCTTTNAHNLEFIAGPLLSASKKTININTTNSLLFSETTTTTTTIDDRLEDGIFIPTSCELIGTGLITVPPVTTTTLCSRPSNLIRVNIYEGYQIVGNSPIVTTGNKQEACDAGNFVNANSAIALPIAMDVMMKTNVPNSDIIGQHVYLGWNTTDCTYVSNGWYYIVFNSEFPYVIQIYNGMIIDYQSCDCSTLTTTTTIVPFINECCSAITTTGTNVTIFDFNNDAMSLTLPNFTSSYGLAVTVNKIWSIYNTGIKEWDITTSPFSAVYLEEINFIGSFNTTFGITAIDDLTLIAVDTSSSPSKIVQINLVRETGVSTVIGNIIPQINLPSDRVMISNILKVKNQDKVVFVNQDTLSSDYYISEYFYSTGILNVETNIGSLNAVAIIDCACVIYLLTPTGDYKILSPEPNYTIIDGAPTGVNLISLSQMPTCSNQGLTSPATTTTTTSLSTTTTTTTLSPTCNEYEVSGPTALYYTDCFGQQQIVSVGSGQIENVCASVSIPGATLIGPCPTYTTTTTTTIIIGP